VAHRTYTEQERREVLADVSTLGVKAAAQRHEVPSAHAHNIPDAPDGDGTFYFGVRAVGDPSPDAAACVPYSIDYRF